MEEEDYIVNSLCIYTSGTSIGGGKGGGGLIFLGVGLKTVIKIEIL